MDGTFSYEKLLYTNTSGEVYDRDTLSDCGDQRSDFYDHQLERKRKRSLGAGEAATDVSDEEPVFAEPPKQLKLEQFLQQLSKITLANRETSGEECGHLVVAATSVSSSNYGVPFAASTDPRAANTVQERMEQKLKRNTTSTTTSGHGTISEGECSSIAKKTSSVSTPSYGSGTNGVVGGSAGSGSGVAQRQPPSSGYESTIQDDEDFEADDDSFDLSQTDSVSNPNKRLLRSKKIRMWRNKLQDSVQHSKLNPGEPGNKPRLGLIVTEEDGQTRMPGFWSLFCCSYR